MKLWPNILYLITGFGITLISITGMLSNPYILLFFIFGLWYLFFGFNFLKINIYINISLAIIYLTMIFTGLSDRYMSNSFSCAGFSGLGCALFLGPIMLIGILSFLIFLILGSVIAIKEKYFKK